MTGRAMASTKYDSKKQFVCNIIIMIIITITIRN
jgi:hypothetical protein